MLDRLRAARGLQDTLAVALADVMALHGAERGNLQLFDARGHLRIVAQRGLSHAFLQAFVRVKPGDGTVCARAALQHQTVSVPDVEQDAACAPFLPIARSAPFRAALSSPLELPQSRAVGIISVYFANPFVPSPLELKCLEGYCAQLARVLCERVPGGDPREVARGLADELMACL